MASSEAFSSSSSDNSSEEDDGTWLDTANRNFQFDEPGDFELPVPPASAVPRPDNAFNVRITWTIWGHRLISGEQDAFDGSAITVSQDPIHGDSDDVGCKEIYPARSETLSPGRYGLGPILGFQYPPGPDGG
jgi:hypothetical protein